MVALLSLTMASSADAAAAPSTAKRHESEQEKKVKHSVTVSQIAE